MHFIPEACHRRPLEPKILVYSRTATAIMMGLSFLAFVTYLAVQMYYDKPLILFSTEIIPHNIQPADLEFCSHNSSLTIVGCNVLLYNWSTYHIPDCFDRFFRTGPVVEYSGIDVHCYIFEANNSYRMMVSSLSSYEYDHIEVARRFDFYWKMDSHLNYSYTSPSVPTIILTLYHPESSPWKNKDFETPVSKQIMLGSPFAAAYMGSVSNIHYTTLKYREIKPGNARALLGFQPDYLETTTLDLQKSTSPLSNTTPPGSIDRSTYDGVVNFRLASNLMEIRSESRQRTLLSSIALSGGIYGLLTTVYIILFGTARLAPWGITRYIPLFNNGHEQYKKDDEIFRDTMNINSKNGKIDGSSDSESINDSNANKKGANFGSKLIRWLFKSKKTTLTYSDKNTMKQTSPLTVDNDGDSMLELGHRTSLHMDHDIRTQLIDAPTVPTQEEESDLSRTSDFLLNNSSQINKKRQSTSSIRENPALTQVVTSSSALFLDSNNESTIAPSSPTYTKRPSISSDIMLYDHTDQQTKPSEDFVYILADAFKQEKEKNKALTTRIDELEVMLQQYFINTTYLNKVKIRRKLSFIDGVDDKKSSKTSK